MIHRQYRTNEAIHLSFLEESGVQKMSRTLFDDCKPWFVKPGKVDTCLCKVCEDFRLAKKAATYNYELLLRPYGSIRTIGKFMFAACLSLKLMRRKYGKYEEYKTDLLKRKLCPIYSVAFNELKTAIGNHYLCMNYAVQVCLLMK